MVFSCRLEEGNSSSEGSDWRDSRYRQKLQLKDKNGNFIVRSPNKFLRPLVGDDVDRPGQSLRFFINETKNK